MQLIAYNSASLNGAPELEGAVLTTQEWTVSAHKLVLHFFPDCLVFYGFLAFLASVGTASHLFPRKVHFIILSLSRSASFSISIITSLRTHPNPHPHPRLSHVSPDLTLALQPFFTLRWALGSSAACSWFARTRAPGSGGGIGWPRRLWPPPAAAS